MRGHWMILLSLAAVACSTETDPVVEGDPCDGSIASERVMVTGSVSLEVRATEACSSLDRPLVAMNWFSVGDPDALAAYNDVAGPLVLKSGARILAIGELKEPIDVPIGTTPTGGPWAHTQFAIPQYTSAADFLAMATSPEFQAAPAKEDAVAPHYEFGFQECLVNCDPDGPQLPTALKGPLLLQHMAVERTAVESGVKQLGGIVYAGYRAANLLLVIGGEAGPVPWQEPPWADATIVYEVADRAAADGLIASDAFQNLAAQSSQQALLLLDVSP